MTQAALAQKAALSQSFISKLENSTRDDASLADLGALATAMEIHLAELVEGTELAPLLGAADPEFNAFCPNPFCKTNKTEKKGGTCQISWGSWATYRRAEFDDISYCTRCGEKLIKECPSCRAGIRDTGKYCARCGHQIHDRPTKDEWSKIRAEHEQETPAQEGMEASGELPF